MFCDKDILNLNQHPELTWNYAQWQHEKWGVPMEAYLDSLQEARESMEEMILVRKEAIDFLAEHAKEWHMKNGKISFISGDLLEQYNQLVEAIG